MKNFVNRAAAAVLFYFLFSNAYGMQDTLQHSQNLRAVVVKLKNPDAICLYKRVFRNDKEGYIVRHKKIKILTEKAYELGDVTLLFREDEKLLDIWAQTITKSGEKIRLKKEDFFIKRIIGKKKGKRLFQCAFSFPQLEPGCTIEYYTKTKIKKYREVVRSWEWEYVENLFVVQAIYEWEILPSKKRKVVVQQGFMEQEVLCEPFFVWKPDSLRGEVTRKGDLLRFRIQSIAPQPEEPYSPPGAVVRPHLLMGYRLPEETYGEAGYWGNYAAKVLNELREFRGVMVRGERLLKEKFANILDPRERARRIYEWFRKNIPFVYFLTQEKDEYYFNFTVDDVLRRRYGIYNEICYALIWMLREAGLKAYPVMVVDRDEGILDKDRGAEQFDSWLVLILFNEQKNGVFCYPGMPFLEFGELPWYCQGIKGFAVLDGVWKIVTTPISSPKKNRIIRTASLELDSTFNLSGEFVESRWGSYATSIRARYWLEGNTDEVANIAKEKIAEELMDAEIGELEISGLDTVGVPVRLKAYVSFKKPVDKIGDMAYLRPLSYLKQSENPFNKRTRRYPIVFPFANEIIETIEIKPPKGWIVESVPSDTTIKNIAGLCMIRFHRTFVGGVNIQRAFTVVKPFWRISNYPSIRELFRANEEISKIPIILRKIE
jgi:hypothetical protein